MDSLHRVVVGAHAPHVAEPVGAAHVALRVSRSWNVCVPTVIPNGHATDCGVPAHCVCVEGDGSTHAGAQRFCVVVLSV